MSRIPKYCLHKATGQAYVTLPGNNGKRRCVYLGVHNSNESRQEYARIIAELSACPTQTHLASGAALTVNEVLAAFLKHAKTYYPPDSSHVDSFIRAMRPIKELYGFKPATEFGPLALKTIRDKLAAPEYENEEGKIVKRRQAITRRGVNRQTDNIKRIFKWAVSEQLIPVAAYQALATVEGIRKNRSTLRESEKVPPVAEAAVAATLPHMPPTVAAMVRIQLLTGMRPQEVCRLRPCEIDTTGAVWLYRPSLHKLTHKDIARNICIGPQAQKVLRDYLPDDPEAFCFTPAKTAAAVLALRSASRVTPRYRSHLAHNEKRRKGKKYNDGAYPVASYRQCIERACLRATLNGTQVAIWKPNQLRHTFATKARSIFGLDAAQAVLGHTKADTTQIYAEVAINRASEVAIAIG